MKARKNLLKILIFLILSGSIINGGYIKKNTIHFTNETVNPQIKEIVRNVDFKTFKIFEENDVEKINSKHHFFHFKSTHFSDTSLISRFFQIIIAIISIPIPERISINPIPRPFPVPIIIPIFSTNIPFLLNIGSKI